MPGIGARLRQARLKAGLTQQRLAGDRYTKAYVSALENGLVNPSMVALEYLAARLGTSASHLIADDQAGWKRVEADLLLAAGRWELAADAFAGLLAGAADPLSRADYLRGAAQALARLDRGPEAASLAAEAAELYDAAGRDVDSALAAHWLAAAQVAQDELDGARATLSAVVHKVRAGLPVAPDVKLRLLIALATVESRLGNHERALSYLDEVSALIEALDDRLRAGHLLELARRYRDEGDHEAAITAGQASRALFDAAQTEVDIALFQNDLALSHLATGDTSRAAASVTRAQATFERLGDEGLLALALEKQAQVRAASGDTDGALALAAESLALAGKAGDQQAAVSALLTTARVQASLGDGAAARAAFEGAADIARRLGKPAVLRRALTEWADHVAGAGDHRTAFELTREALGT